VGVGRGQQDLRDLLGSAAELRCVADGKIKAAVVVNNLGNGCAANGGLDDVVDVLRLKTIARGFQPVDGDHQAGLAGDIEDANVGDAGNLLHDAGDLIGDVRQIVEVVTEELERIFAFDARHRLLDVVLDVLREIEIDAGILLKAAGDGGDELLLAAVELRTPLGCGL
jgi:hypothetical protein